MMKYYRDDDESPDFWPAIQRYVDYIESVRHLIPCELQLLCNRRAPFSPERIYLNDSQVNNVHADFGNRTVQIALLGESLGNDKKALGSRLFTLNYGDVRSLAYHGASGRDFPFAVHCDHIWDEIEVLEQSLFEHRMLFAGKSGGLEMSIVFGEFSASYTDTLNSGFMEP